MSLGLSEALTVTKPPSNSRSPPIKRGTASVDCKREFGNALEGGDGNFAQDPTGVIESVGCE